MDATGSVTAVDHVNFRIEPGLVEHAAERYDVAHDRVPGAGRRPGSIGRTILLNIRDAGFAGTLYAVNPHGDDIEGIPCVPSVAALPEVVTFCYEAVRCAPDDVEARRGRRCRSAGAGRGLG